MDHPDSEIVSLPVPLGALATGGACRVQWRLSAQARRVSLRICPRNGLVIIVLPPRAGRQAGLALLHDNAPWVTERLAALAPAAPFAAGGQAVLAGQTYVIRHEPALRGPAFLDRGALVVPGDAAVLPRRVVDFLRGEAKLRIGALAALHAATLGAPHGAIRLKDTRTRWGSCAPDGTLAFSWRLVMAPDWVLDYVVAHEVAHLREMNHSARFWALVAQLTPHRDAAVAWLKAQGPSLLRAGG